ncbi:MAG: UTP--glucose-1-phosphate uridylyltransferase [Chloroflexi bacterium]|nr:UTP--glucose-1-phosphate uridylyltransferase [Chloroflexota bacterium]
MLIDLITSSETHVRDRSLDASVRDLSLDALLRECAALEAFRKRSDNLYERVRALFFLASIHRYHAPSRPETPTRGRVPYIGHQHMLQRRFEDAITEFLHAQTEQGASAPLSSALAEAYHRLAFETLAAQVRRSVRSVRGNQWMFRIGHPSDQPLRIVQEMLHSENGVTPILCERTPVRMDLSHSAWSDIFFLGMDYPEGARVLNVSIDLAVRGRDEKPKPPVEAYFRIIDEPVLRLTSVDLQASADIRDLNEVFDFARDYLGLLKAAVIASGIIPPGIEGSGASLEQLLVRLAGPGRGIELVSSVNDIPKGSRLAVSTNLLAGLIAVCMRATGQARSLTGALTESERRLVAARAILGEWLAGSGGGWQDSGGVWPGMKLIRGVTAAEGDPEFGVSRGRLLPTHHILDEHDAPARVRKELEDSLILVHGGMAQNVGPILEMVTEKYLLRSETEWRARGEAVALLEDILAALRGEHAGNAAQRIGELTTRNFFGPLQAIIPWASNRYTELLIERARAAFGNDFWGFWMLGGMSGGGMGFIVAPHIKQRAQNELQRIMLETKRELQAGLPFAMDPVVYDFSINPTGTSADMNTGAQALMPAGYYALHVPTLVKRSRDELPALRRAELDHFGAATRRSPELRGMTQVLFDRLFPQIAGTQRKDGATAPLDVTLNSLGFDRVQHEQIRNDLRTGRIGLAQNRLPANSLIEDVHPQDVLEPGELASQEKRLRAIGIQALRSGAVGVVSLSAGVGSRWTQGAGVVKALNPFARLGGSHRSFIEVHLAKSRRAAQQYGTRIPHILTTSHLTHDAVEQLVRSAANDGVAAHLSPGRAIGLRMIPTVRDLRFLYEEMPQQVLDEQKQKMRESAHRALIGWAQSAGEASDYTDNLPEQCLHPVGHWYEVPNMLRNGVLARVLRTQPALRYLMLHNIDTLGADLDPAMLGAHITSGACLSFEMITRNMEDRGGGLARVDGRVRLVEGLAMPDDKAEFGLSYYNSNTTWIDVDALLSVFVLSRSDLDDEAKVLESIRRIGARMPTYVTLKDVKKRWGHGQEDIFPVAQFEKLWGDMTALPEVRCSYIAVPRLRGQQLKDPAQLDGWLRDGSAAYVETLCAFE